eukprot:COSAG01_NODE_28901_length_650_cov_0.776770_1_plen_197_part_01
MAELAAIAGQPLSEVQAWSGRHSAAVQARHAVYENATAQAYAPLRYPPGLPWSSVVELRGSQTSNAMALALGAPPDAATRALACDALVESVNQHGNHLTVGIFGMQVLFQELARCSHNATSSSSSSGRGDLALSILLTDTYPGLGRMSQQNQTTLCEDWTCTAHHTDGLQSAAGDSDSRSLNHIMYGAFHTWLIEGL